MSVTRVMYVAVRGEEYYSGWSKLTGDIYKAKLFDKVCDAKSLPEEFKLKQVTVNIDLA